MQTTPTTGIPPKVQITQVQWDQAMCIGCMAAFFATGAVVSTDPMLALERERIAKNIARGLIARSHHMGLI